MNVRTLDMRTQQGFSLVELMVSMVVGLLLLAGVLQILLSNRESLSAQQSMVTVQENARVASFMLDNIIAHAGYRAELDRDDLFDAATQAQKGARFGHGAYVASAAGGPGESDRLRVRFQAATDHNGCSGPEPDVTDRTQSLKVVDVLLYVNDNDTLLCRDYSKNDGATAEPLVENVARLNLAYGLDSDQDGSVEAYADEVAPNAAPDVLSVQVQLLLQSEANALPANHDYEFEFADGNPFEKTDRRAYVFVDRVIALRNAVP